MAYSNLPKFTKIFYKLLETDYHLNILLNLLIDGILDLNVGTTNFKTFQPPFDTFLLDTLP